MKVLMLSWEYTPHIVGGLGKHVVEIVPPRTRMVRAVREGCSAFETM